VSPVVKLNESLSLIETERCSIKTLHANDVSDVGSLYVNHEVRKYLGGPRQEVAISTLLDEMLAPTDNSYYWVVREKKTDRFIGLVSLDPHHDGVNMEVSYQFLPEWWGKGFATEVVQVIIDSALNILNLGTIVAETQTANEPSCRLLEKLGMKLEKTVYRFGAEQAIYVIKST